MGSNIIAEDKKVTFFDIADQIDQIKSNVNGLRKHASIQWQFLKNKTSNANEKNKFNDDFTNQSYLNDMDQIARQITKLNNNINQCFSSDPKIKALDPMLLEKLSSFMSDSSENTNNNCKQTVESVSKINSNKSPDLKRDYSDKNFKRLLINDVRTGVALKNLKQKYQQIWQEISSKVNHMADDNFDKNEIRPILNCLDAIDSLIRLATTLSIMKSEQYEHEILVYFIVNVSTNQAELEEFLRAFSNAITNTDKTAQDNSKPNVLFVTDSKDDMVARFANIYLQGKDQNQKETKEEDALASFASNSN